MPKFGEDVDLTKHAVGHFGFTAVNTADLESSGYTLATVVCDRSGSTSGFQNTMEAALKASVEALRKHPQSDSIMLRVLTVDNDCQEQHGYIPLADIDVSRYDGMLQAQGMTALFDGCINAAEGATAYGAELHKNHFNANGILIVITDGINNHGRFSHPSDVAEVAKAFENTKRKEALESYTTILIAVGMEDSSVEQVLRDFHRDAEFSVDMIALKDAKPETIAKIGAFITSSVSSTSQSLGKGGPSQAIKF